MAFASRISPVPWSASAPRSIRAFVAARKRLPSIAVLPFRDLAEGDGDPTFSEGVADEVIRILSRVEGLRVVSPTTSALWNPEGAPLAEAGQGLHADALLSGAFRKREGGLTLEASFLEVKTGRQVWTLRCDIERRALLATLADLAVRSSTSLGLAAPDFTPGTVDPEAHDCFLKGRKAYHRFNRQGMETAALMFRRALEIQPDYASAWAGLALCAAYAYIYVERKEHQRESAEACSLKALALDPGLAEAHAARGVALSALGRAEEAEAAFEQAILLDPNLFEGSYFYARHCLSAGKLEPAVQFFEWAAAVRPEDFQAILLVAQVYHSLGIPEEAERARRKGLALAEQRLRAFPDDVRARYMGANALVALGERERGLAWARMARDLDPGDSMLLYNLGCINALAGDTEEALTCLEMAAAGGLTQKGWYLNDGDLDSIRPSPRFQALLDRMAD